jgi:hypothetical protein
MSDRMLCGCRKSLSLSLEMHLSLSAVNPQSPLITARPPLFFSLSGTVALGLVGERLRGSVDDLM